MPRERLGIEIGQDGGLWVWGGCFSWLGRVPTARCVGGGGGRGGKVPPHTMTLPGRPRMRAVSALPLPRSFTLEACVALVY